VPLPPETDELFGTDFLEKTGADINFDIGKMSLYGVKKAPCVRYNISTKRTALNVFPSDTPENNKLLQTCKKEPNNSRTRLDSHALYDRTV